LTTALRAWDKLRRERYRLTLLRLAKLIIQRPERFHAGPGFFVAGVKKTPILTPHARFCSLDDKAMNQYGDTLYQFGSLASQLAL
jgi:hypothetical protein